jgi:uncharacterized protein YggE
LRLAVHDARQRADYAARGAGVTIDRVVRVEEQRSVGGPIVYQARMAAMQKESLASTPVEAGEIEVRAQVTLTAAIR